MTIKTEVEYNLKEDEKYLHCTINGCDNPVLYLELNGSRDFVIRLCKKHLTILLEPIDSDGEEKNVTLQDEKEISIPTGEEEVKISQRLENRRLTKYLRKLRTEVKRHLKGIMNSIKNKSKYEKMFDYDYVRQVIKEAIMVAEFSDQNNK